MAMLPDLMVKASVLLLVAVLLAGAMRRASAALRHLVWIAILGAVVLLPIARFTLPAVSLSVLTPAQETPRSLMAPRGATTASESSRIAVTGPHLTGDLLSEAPPRLRRTWTLAGILATLWLVGVGIFLAQSVVGTLSVRRLVRNARPAADSALTSHLERIRARLSLHRSITLLVATRESMPVTWGVLHPTILLPSSAATWPRDCPGRLDAVLLHEVAHDLIPRAVGDAMRERGVEPVDTPDIRDVVVEEGQALTFTASFDTLPPFEPGDYSTLSLRRPLAQVDEAAVDEALERLRQRAARYEPVEGRGLVEGDTAVVNLTRRKLGADGGPDTRNDVSVELGSKANPPGFDEQLLGLEIGAAKSFAVTYPADYAIAELAQAEVAYTVTLNGIKRRVVPELDDEFAKDLGDTETLVELRASVRGDLEHEARHAAERAVRGELMKQLAARLPFEVPASLVEREIDRRVEDFAHRLVEQNLDPRQAGIDWRAFRESQRGVAREAVAGALVLDEVARREQLDPTDAEVEQELARYAERSGRTSAAVRAALEKEGGLSRVYGGLRREKSIDFLMARATIASE